MLLNIPPLENLMKKLAAALIASAFTMVAFAQDKVAPAAPAAPAAAKKDDMKKEVAAKKPMAKKHHKSAKKPAAKPAA